jgi:hypothetical protein
MLRVIIIRYAAMDYGEIVDFGVSLGESSVRPMGLKISQHYFRSQTKRHLRARAKLTTHI